MRRLINQHPGRGARLALGALPFIALLAVSFIAVALTEVASNTATASILLPILARVQQKNLECLNILHPHILPQHGSDILRIIQHR